MFDESPVHTLTSLPATDLNFTSCLQRATDNQIRLALETMRNRDGKDKGRIKSCERELKRREKQVNKYLEDWKMDWRDATKIRLLADFDGSFFNEREEFIAHRYSNTYFIFSNCESLEDVNCKVLEWLSRAADKGIPYRQDWRNKKFQRFMLNGINLFLHTDFSKEDIDLIYTYLGNACNHNRTLEFVRSGYDMELLRQIN